MNCPTCKGTGEIPITMHVFGSKAAPTVTMINCIDCDGKGDVTPKEAKETEDFHKAYEAAWCKCGNPSGETHYHPKGTKTCGKHCYTCADCHKLVQIG